MPLDGSLLAEKALPYAEQIARTSGSEITLLHVMPKEVRSFAPKSPASEAQLVEMDAAKYLETIMDSLHQSTDARQAILTGLPSLEIAQMAQDGPYDIIVMSSHGYSGPGRGAFGGIAERVLHGCHVPVLIVPQWAKVPDV